MEPEYISSEEPPPESALNIKGSFEEIVEPADTKPVRRITNLKSFLWEDAGLLMRPRSYYLDRQRNGEANSEAWALGGTLQYSTGRWLDRFRLGASMYTSQKLHGPNDKDGTLLLKHGQNGFTVLGEAYLEARLHKNTNLSLYRQKLNLPYVNKQDNRMAPNTFETYIVRDIEDPELNYIAGHITRMKKRNETSFIHMSEAAGAVDANKGLTMAGARYNFTPEINLGAVNFHAWDVMNIFYTEANAAWPLGENLALSLSGQYTSQKSIGDELIGDFDTGVYGSRLAMSYNDAILSLAYTSTDDNDSIRSPYGGYPGFISLIVEDFNRAGEDAWLVGLSYNFSRFGLAGLSTFVNYADGNTPDNGPTATPDQKEIDFTIDYTFGRLPLEGFWIRARYAHVDQDGPAAVDIDDYRVILNYSIPLH